MNLYPVYRASAALKPLPPLLMNLGAAAVCLIGLPVLVVAYYCGRVK